jgi:hypothetical protein
VIDGRILIGTVTRLITAVQLGGYGVGDAVEFFLLLFKVFCGGCRSVFLEPFCSLFDGVQNLAMSVSINEVLPDSITEGLNTYSVFVIIVDLSA